MSTRNGDIKKRRRRATSKVRRKLNYDILPELVGYQLRRAQLAMFQDFMSVAGELKITPGQFGVMTLIAANPGLNQSELGEAMGVDRSTMVAVIDKLETSGFVLRKTAPNDRRSYALQLSKSGEALMARLRPAVLQHEKNLAAPLNETEQSQLIEYLRRVADNIP